MQPTTPYGSFQGAGVEGRLIQVHGKIVFRYGGPGPLTEAISFQKSEACELVGVFQSCAGGALPP